MKIKMIASAAIISGNLLYSVAVSAEEAFSSIRLPNFEVGASGGLLSSEQYYGLDVTINMPITRLITTQFLINSDYLVGNSSKQSYSQSEVTGNVFIRNGSGKFGTGLGYKERKPNDEELDKESSTILNLYGDLYFGDLTVGMADTKYEDEIDTFSGQSLKVEYYLDENRKFYLRKEKVIREDILIVGVALQPEKFSNQAGLDLTFETGDDHFYIGLGVSYFFDTHFTLKKRDRDFR
ncbi:hypothetical protein O1D97_02490 [Marinomonas sp. 15G1-11]|uniref:Transporter n=1 Tax=Marinomonas phaeophyticola TaxID=3004091 RepID=A0ABT4JRU4_9GAMM|nr:hypothetical protein [Marinomonas sp. 15G1-11]MCZ2720543.1 hypothetical protein [Marinomonas sp. 15G1-11]